MRRPRHDSGHHVFCPDPFGVTTGRAAKFRARFNPMTILNPGSLTMIEDAGLITDAIIVQGNTQDPHWDESARGFLEGVILFVATDQLYEGRRHLAMVRDLIAGQATSGGETGMDVLAAQMRANNAADPIVLQMIIDAAEDFFSKPDDERGSVLSNTRRHLRFLSYPQIRDSVSGHDFDLSDLKTGIDGKPVTIYLCLPAMRMATCNRWLRLFVNLALAAMEATQGKPKPPVLFCLDEFPVLGTVKSIEDGIGMMAGFGVRLWPIIQDLGQLKALYKDRWQSFLGNAGAVQFFCAILLRLDPSAVYGQYCSPARLLTFARPLFPGIPHFNEQIHSMTKRFFLSRAGADQQIVAAIAEIIEAAGHEVILQQWDFQNAHFLNKMHEALETCDHVIALLSPGYMASDHCKAEWQGALAPDPLNKTGRLIVLRVSECAPRGLELCSKVGDGAMIRRRVAEPRSSLRCRR